MKKIIPLLIIVVSIFQSCKKDEVTTTQIDGSKVISKKFDLFFEYNSLDVSSIDYSLKIPGLFFKPRPTLIINKDTIISEWEIVGDSILLSGTIDRAKTLNYTITYYGRATSGTFALPEISNVKINKEPVLIFSQYNQIIKDTSSYTLTFDTKNLMELVIKNEDEFGAVTSKILNNNSYTFLPIDIVSKSIFINLNASKKTTVINSGNFGDGNISGLYRYITSKPIDIKP